VDTLHGWCAPISTRSLCYIRSPIHVSICFSLIQLESLLLVSIHYIYAVSHQKSIRSPLNHSSSLSLIKTLEDLTSFRLEASTDTALLMELQSQSVSLWLVSSDWSWWAIHFGMSHGDWLNFLWAGAVRVPDVTLLIFIHGGVSEARRKDPERTVKILSERQSFKLIVKPAAIDWLRSKSHTGVTLKPSPHNYSGWEKEKRKEKAGHIPITKLVFKHLFRLSNRSINPKRVLETTYLLESTSKKAGASWIFSRELARPNLFGRESFDHINWLYSIDIWGWHIEDVWCSVSTKTSQAPLWHVQQRYVVMYVTRPSSPS
jgi:hypothetical protein